MQRDAEMAFKKILCPIDFSAPSRLALRHAVQLAVDASAQLVVAHVWQSPMHSEYSEGILHNELLAPLLAEQEGALAEAERDAKALGAVRVTTKLLYGVPWDAIARETRADPEYDLVVLGTHGRTGIKHVLIGSVAERVARHASCPVLLVRAKESSPH